MASNMMGAGRYKLIRHLANEEGFAAYAALDVETAELEDVLLNIYTGKSAVERTVSLYYEMDAAICRDFCRIYTEDGRFTAVFALHTGIAFDIYFAQDQADDTLRQDYMESLLHGALENARMPPRLLQGLLRRENIVVQQASRRVCINACIPVGASNDCQAIFAPAQLSPLAEVVLKRRWSACDEQIAFMDALQTGQFGTLSALYSAWRVLVPAMEADRKKNAVLMQVFRFIKRAFRGWVKQVQQKRRERKRRMQKEAA